MKTSIRSLLVLSAVAFVLAACASVAPSTPSADPSTTPTPTPTVAPSDAPAETPDATPEVIGTLTVVGAAVDGPGESLESAMTGDLSEPVFIRGFVFKDTDGQVYFADSMTDGPRIAVEGHPTDGPTWDIGDAGVTGLQEADGVLFYENAAIYGTLEV
ncbi:MAG: hypothetical protein ABI534_11180 [Chloroflexota bacterium]